MGFTGQPSIQPEIISYTSRYQQEVIDLILPIQQTEFGVAVKLSDQPDLTMIPEFYQSGNGQFWIALVQGKVVGTIGLLDIGQERGALRKMFVHAHYRGADYGTGQALLDRLLRYATEKSLREILLGTTEKFIAAHKFYEKNGFEQIAKSHLPPEFPIMAVDVKFYRLQLAGHRKQCPHFFVLTGGPGAGKTAVLDALKRRGHHCFHEVARDIIREQVAAGGDALPWMNTLKYRQIMMVRTLSQFNYAAHGPAATCFFDRGIIDVISYSRLINAPIGEYLHMAALQNRYNTRVFIFPPWEAIYATDTERKQSFDEAVKTHDLLQQAYTEYGYHTIAVPPASIEARADFILGAIH